MPSMLVSLIAIVLIFTHLVRQRRAASFPVSLVSFITWAAFGKKWPAKRTKRPNKIKVFIWNYQEHWTKEVEQALLLPFLCNWCNCLTSIYFIAQLDYTLGDVQLSNIFSDAWKVSYAKIIRNKNRRSRGFAIVKMGSQTEADRVSIWFQQYVSLI